MYAVQFDRPQKIGLINFHNHRQRDQLVGGSVIIEVIFNIPGMGLLSYEGVMRREYDLVMTTLMLSAVMTLLGILVSDVLYVVVNPRVSFEDQ